MTEQPIEEHTTNQDALIATLKRIQRQDERFYSEGSGARCPMCGAIVGPTDVTCFRCGYESLGFRFFRGGLRFARILLIIALVAVFAWVVYFCAKLKSDAQEENEQRQRNEQTERQRLEDFQRQQPKRQDTFANWINTPSHR